jgi:hypothetical protein
MPENEKDGFEEMVKAGAQIAMRAAAAYLRKNGLQVADYDVACACLRSWLRIKIEEAGRMVEKAGHAISAAAIFQACCTEAGIEAAKEFSAR